ncbi:MAG: hypothetical protein OEQ13_03695 [Acidobacteriota bacterium]|nr:hypothetical protein [Acidobacteriota bacterium]
MTVLVLEVRVGPVIDEHGDDIELAVNGRAHECRAAVVGLDVRICPVVEEKLHGVEGTDRRDNHEDCHVTSAAKLEVEIGALGQMLAGPIVVVVHERIEEIQVDLPIGRLNVRLVDRPELTRATVGAA